MSRITVQRRGRNLAALASAMGLVIGAAALTSGPAGSAEPAGDCTEAFPLADVTKGQLVEGLTVDSGVTPEPFAGEVIGVLEGGIAPDLDMIIMELDSAAIDDAGGIWQGMSGSPVYDATDGRLIGAVAYGLAYGPSPIAGITPFEEMDDYLASVPAGPGRVALGKPLARQIATESGVTAAQAGHGLRQLPMPLGVSGVSARRLESLDARPYLSQQAYATGTAGVAGDPAAEDIVAGGNIAASQSYGDITAAGVGTATQVCDGRVVGFGHPLAFSGDATLSMHPADALYVQPESLGAPFKVANLGAPVGTITDDRMAGITGSFGDLPDSMTVTSELISGDRSREGSTDVTVPMAAPEITFYQLLANHDRVIDGWTGGTETQTWSVTGTDAQDRPFEVSFSNRYTSPSDITFTASVDLADIVYAFSELPGVTLDEVTAVGEVTSSKATYQVKGVQQWRQGAWVPVTRKAPALARAGTKLLLRTVLGGPSGRTYVPTTFTLPKRATRMAGIVFVSGGGSGYGYEDYDEYEEYDEYGPSSVDTLPKLLAAIKEMVRNDAIEARLMLGNRRLEIERERVLGPFDLVVQGNRGVPVLVR